MSYAFIDGTVEKGFIKEFRTVHPACSFEYKPMLIEQRALMIKEIGTIRDAAKAELLVISRLADRIKKWDLADRDGEVMPIEGKTIAKLKPALYNRLAGIVLYGSEASDDNPSAEVEERFADAELEAMSAISESSVEDTRQEAIIKN